MDPEQIWDDYYARIKTRRLAESNILWQALIDQGVSTGTILAVDFVHFGQDKADAEALADQLSENYNVTLELGEEGYWWVKGTTRPYGTELEADQHKGWVDFMADVARSHNCVFSTWSIEAPSLGVRCCSESIETDDDDR